MPRVVHFQMYADNPSRAERFYADVFDWSLNQWAGDNTFWLINTGDEAEPGINGGMLVRPEPSATTTVVMQVPSVDEYSQRITDAGGTETIPKFAIPGVGYAAYFIDTEGNPIGIFQDDEGAA
ncbi:MAG: VOC family protein [Chloroflexota bacterium]|nr:VOC family protein [Chloroflexota bacterium]